MLQTSKPHVTSLQRIYTWVCLRKSKCSHLCCYSVSLYPTENIKYWYHKCKCNCTYASLNKSDLIINTAAAAAFICRQAGKTSRWRLPWSMCGFCLQPKVSILALFYKLTLSQTASLYHVLLEYYRSVLSKKKRNPSWMTGPTRLK